MAKIKRSCAWNYFEKCDSDESLSVCQLCKKNIAHASTTSNLFKVPLMQYFKYIQYTIITYHHHSLAVWGAVCLKIF